MFESLSDRLQGVFKKLRGKGRVTEADVNEALREVRLALLEADVSLKVVKDFIGKIREQATGVDVLEGLSPVQQIVKIVNDELVELLGGENVALTLAPSPPTVIMLCGLQGSGKTTLCGKLATFYKKQGRNPMMVACDIYRPAAVKQLQVLGTQVKIPVFSSPADAGKSPPSIAMEAIQSAKANGNDIVILDTAGRLAIDEELMDELGQMKAWLSRRLDPSYPHEILLVVDAMVGQDAVNFAEQFNQRLALTGIVMTKMDGDTRGGAALSIRAVTGVPIKFMGVSEKMDGLEPFYPDRLASRILGMGDILSLIEKAQEAIDEKDAMLLEQKTREGKFDFHDYLNMMNQMRKLGPIENIMKMIPGFNSKEMREALSQIDPKIMQRKEAIVQSMTPAERSNPALLNGNRRKRIAVGSGHTLQEVNQFLSAFEQMKKQMKMMTKMMPGAGNGKGNASAAAPTQIGGLKKMPKSGKRPAFRFGR